MDIDELFKKAQEDGITDEEQALLLAALAEQMQQLEKEDPAKYQDAVKKLTEIAKEVNEELRELEELGE
jgi:hypothetical protein